MTPYRRGLHEVADGVHAWLQPDGGWGWSNAGLIVGDGASLLVDTLFDLALTQSMLDAMEPITTRSPIATLVNTHANGDHCYGNSAVPVDDIVASEASAAEMAEVSPALMSAMVTSDLGDEALNRYVRDAFGPFEFDGIEMKPPTRTFSGQLWVDVGGQRVELVEVGPAHTAGDVLAHLPRRGVVFTGDICFIGGTPIVWAGPIQNWLDACDWIVGTGATVIVPGHGPVCGPDEVVAVDSYLRLIRSEAELRFNEGMSAPDAANDIDLGEFAAWGEPERIAINVDAVYRELDPTRPPTPVLELFATMAHWRNSGRS